MNRRSTKQPRGGSALDQVIDTLADLHRISGEAHEAIRRVSRCICHECGGTLTTHKHWCNGWEPYERETYERERGMLP